MASDSMRSAVSRRDFARRVVVAAAAATLPRAALGQTSESPQPAASTVEVPKEVAAEVEM